MFKTIRKILDKKFKKMEQTFESCGLKLKICRLYQNLYLVVLNMPCRKLELNRCQKRKERFYLKQTKKTKKESKTNKLKQKE